MKVNRSGKIFFTISLLKAYVCAAEKDSEETYVINTNHYRLKEYVREEPILQSKKRFDVSETCEDKVNSKTFHTKVPNKATRTIRNSITIQPSKIEIILRKDQKIPSFPPDQLKEIREVSITCRVNFSHFGIGAPLFASSAKQFLEGTTNLKILTITDDLSDLIFSAPTCTKICLQRHPNTTIYGSWEYERQEQIIASLRKQGRSAQYKL